MNILYYISDFGDACIGMVKQWKIINREIFMGKTNILLKFRALSSINLLKFNSSNGCNQNNSISTHAGQKYYKGKIGKQRQTGVVTSHL